MKHIYLTLSAFAIISNSFAQITLQATDINSTVGETFTSYTSNYVNEGASGNNVTWDLSALSSTGTHTTAVEAANSGFPSSNKTYNLDNNIVKIYQLDNSTSQQMYGSYSSATLISYSDPMQMLVFPLNSSVNSTDSHAATFTSGGMPFTRTGTTNVKYDGYGTLITPEGTFTDVVRICLTQIYSDNYAGGTLNYNVVAYAWYKAGIHKELASVTTFTTFQGTNTYGTYLETDGLGINEVDHNILMISPNPATDNINIVLKEGENIESIQVVNLNGKIEKEFNLISTNSKIINIEDINTGIYMLMIKTKNGNVLTERIVKQ